MKSSSLINFRFAVGISFTDFTIWELPNTDAIRIEDILLSIRKFNCFNSCFFNLLNCAVWEDTLFLSVFKDALYCPIRESTVKNKVSSTQIRCISCTLT